MSAPHATALATTAPSLMFTFSEEQTRLIRETFANGASDAEFAFLMEIARARRLSPLLRQIHFVQRWDSEKGCTRWATQVSIDGLRAVAERTGNYAGQDEPEFVENPDGSIKLCKVRVWRKDWTRASVGVAHWSEYVQTCRDKQTGKQRPTAMWARMPHVMLAKCAEAVALRKAFPEDMAGLYSADEMAQAQNDGDVVDVLAGETVRQINADVVLAPVEVPAVTSAAPPQLAPPVVDVVTPAPAVTSAAPAPVVSADDGPPVDPPAPPETRVEREPANDVATIPPKLEGFYARLPELELAGEAVAVWMKHRAELAAAAGPDREAAWKALCKRTEEVGKMKNAKVWLKKAIAEEDARRQTTEAQERAKAALAQG